MRTTKFLTAFCALLIAIFLQLAVGGMTGVYPNLALAALIAATFFLPFFEFIILTLFGIAFLNWQPMISLEMAVFTLIPIAVFLFRRIIFPLEGIVSVFAALAASILGFSVLLGWRFVAFFLAAPAAGGTARFAVGSTLVLSMEVLALDLVVSVLFGALLFSLFRWAYDGSSA